MPGILRHLVDHHLKDGQCRVDGRPCGNRVGMRAIKLAQGDAIEGHAGVVRGLLELAGCLTHINTTRVHIIVPEF